MLKMTENVPDEKLKTEEKKTVNRPSYKTLYEDLLNKQRTEQKLNLVKDWNEINALLINSLSTIKQLIKDEDVLENRVWLWKTHIEQLQLIHIVIKDFNQRYNNSFKSTILDELNNQLNKLSNGK